MPNSLIMWCLLTAMDSQQRLTLVIKFLVFHSLNFYTIFFHIICSFDVYYQLHAIELMRKRNEINNAVMLRNG